MSAPFHPATRTPNSSSSDSSIAADTIEQLKQKLDSTEQRLQFAELKILVLEERLRLQRIAKYGPGSEKLSDAQLELLELEPGVSRAEIEAESQREALPSTPKTKHKHPGRQSLPQNLPRIERVIACTSEQCVCRGCGGKTALIGYEESQQLDVEPAKYFVLLTKREKRACKQCEERGVFAAPLPARIIEKSLVSDRIVIDTVVNKYANHSPLYRQSVILLRDAGLDISRATLDGWVMRVGELLTPIVGVMGRELLGGSYIQADETPVDVQMHDGRGKNHQAYLWQYGTPGGAAVFDFRLGRGRDGPKQFLKDFEGILQTDGYVVYDHVAGARVVHAACWAHARRGFFEAVQLNRADVVATRIVARIDELFAIDGRAREEKLDHVARHALRQQYAPSLLEVIRHEIEQCRLSALPASTLGKACRYTLTLWHKLTRFLEYPELELSNNRAENSMRPIAIGRNYVQFPIMRSAPKRRPVASLHAGIRQLNHCA